MSTVILITGYRRMGKDTLARCIIDHHNLVVPEWTYKYNTPVTNITGDFYRIAIADNLKQRVHDMLGLTGSIQDYEDIKDKPIFDNGRKSLRDYYIEVGNMMRYNNPYYWIDLTINSMKMVTDKIPIISDWRFRLEYDRLIQRNYKPITIRVHRDGVPIPSMDIESEHSLDDFVVDIISTPA